MYHRPVQDCEVERESGLCLSLSNKTGLERGHLSLTFSAEEVTTVWLKQLRQVSVVSATRVLPYCAIVVQNVILYIVK